MPKAEIPANEKQRLQELRALNDNAFYVFLPKRNEAGLQAVLKNIQQHSSSLQTKLKCPPDYRLSIKGFMWNPNDPETIEELVSKGKELLI